MEDCNDLSYHNIQQIQNQRNLQSAPNLYADVNRRRIYKYVQHIMDYGFKNERNSSTNLLNCHSFKFKTIIE